MSETQKVEIVQGIKESFGNLPAASVPKDPAAVALGSKAYGKPKTLTDEERARRSDHMKRVTAERIARRQSQAPSPVPEPGPVVPAPSAPSSAGGGTRVVAIGVPVKKPMRYVSKGVPVNRKGS